MSNGEKKVAIIYTEFLKNEKGKLMTYDTVEEANEVIQHVHGMLKKNKTKNKKS